MKNNLPSETEVKAMETAFAKVCNKTDWKAPINAVVHRNDLLVTLKAIEFYTATQASLNNFGNGMIQVISVGYRMGPAGDR